MYFLYFTLRVISHAWSRRPQYLLSQYFLNFQDILHTVVEFSTPPMPNHMLNQVFVLRNLSAALSACIYQCLCDSDNFVVAMSDNISVGMEGFTRMVGA